MVRVGESRAPVYVHMNESQWQLEESVSAGTHVGQVSGEAVHKTKVALRCEFVAVISDADQVRCF